MSPELSCRATFMFGFERSGTTLLSMMMGAHPQLAVPLTVTGLWYSYGQRLDDYNDLQTDRDVERLVGDLLKEERISLWDEPLSREDIMEVLENRSFPSVVQAFHIAYASKKSKPLWANLDIATLDEMDTAYQWFPNARFIHIVRDGRDVALSHETMPFGSSNTLDCARSWNRRLTINQKMGRILKSSQYKTIRFEDLVNESESTLTELCEFIGVEYSPRMLEYGDMVAGKIPENRRWLWPELDKKPQSSKCYGWKTKMAEKKRIVFEGHAGKVLSNLGYEIYENTPKMLSAYLYELWCYVGTQGRYRRLGRKLGVSQMSLLEKQWKKNHGS